MDIASGEIVTAACTGVNLNHFYYYESTRAANWITPQVTKHVQMRYKTYRVIKLFGGMYLNGADAVWISRAPRPTSL